MELSMKNSGNMNGCKNQNRWQAGGNFFYKKLGKFWTFCYFFLWKCCIYFLVWSLFRVLWDQKAPKINTTLINLFSSQLNNVFLSKLLRGPNEAPVGRPANATGQGPPRNEAIQVRLVIIRPICGRFCALISRVQCTLTNSYDDRKCTNKQPSFANLSTGSTIWPSIT